MEYRYFNTTYIDYHTLAGAAVITSVCIFLLVLLMGLSNEKMITIRFNKTYLWDFYSNIP